MAQFKAFESGVEVNGQTVNSFVDGVPDAFEDKALGILATHDIEAPHPDEWYPQRAWLDAFDEIATEVGTATLTQIGESIPESAEWPPDVDSVTGGLDSIDDAYHMNHRGGDIGHYRVERTGDGEVTVRCNNPYPCAFDEGIVRAVASEFADGYPAVTEVGNECRSDGGDECVYEVTW
jgi:hypothetical protein